MFTWTLCRTEFPTAAQVLTSFSRLKFFGEILSYNLFFHKQKTKSKIPRKVFLKGCKLVSSLLWLCDAAVRTFGQMWGCVGQSESHASHSLHLHRFLTTPVVFCMCVCVCVLVCLSLSSTLWAALLIWCWSVWNTGCQHRQLGRRQPGRTCFLQNSLFKK